MKAVRWHGPGDVRVDDVPEPQAGPGEVVIRVTACGICGSDVGEFHHGPIYIPQKPHPLTGLLPPVTLGHEFCGTVAEIGPGVSGRMVGERVTVNPCLVCGECAACRAGQPNYCEKLGSLGLSADGAFAPLVKAPAYGVLPIPPSLGDAEGSFVEPLAVVLHAISRSRLTPDEPVAVVGAGPIGLLLIQALQARRARCVIAIEPRPARRELALQLGARAAIDPLTGNPGREIAALLDGARAAVAFECVGTTAGFETALRSTGRGGRVVLIGLLPASASVNLLAVLAHEKEIIGASAYVDEFDEAIRLLAGRSVVVGPLVTGEISIEETVIGGLEVLGRPDSAHVKILVRPH